MKRTKKSFMIILVTSALASMMLLSSCALIEGIVPAESGREIVERVGEKNAKLFLSCNSGNLSGMREALEEGADPEDMGYGSTYYSPSDHCAIGFVIKESDHEGLYNQIKALLDGGADPTGAKSHRFTYLQYAAMRGDYELMKLLIDAGADLGVQGKGVNKRTPLSIYLDDKPELRISKTEYESSESGGPSVNTFDAEKTVKCLDLFIRNGSRVDKKVIAESLRSDSRLISAPILVKEAVRNGESTGLSKAMESIVLGKSGAALKSIKTLKTKEKQNAVLFASAFGSRKLLGEMVKRGYDFSAKIKGFDLSVFDAAAAYNGLDELKYLSKLVRKPFGKNKWGESALSCAVDACNHRTEGWLAGKIGYTTGKDKVPSYGYDDDEDYDYYSGFIIACLAHNKSTIRKLLERDKRITQKEVLAAYKELVWACDEKGLKLAYDLVEDCPYLKQPSSSSLIEFPDHGNEKCVEFLVDHGIRPDMDAIEEAIMYCSDGSINRLLKKADLGDNATAYAAYAIESGRYGAVRILLDRGAKPDAPDEDGYTLLHYAAEGTSHEITALILDSCEDPEAAKTLKTGKGKTPYDLAKETGLSDIMSLLKTQ